jgi:hypothetical protein
VRAELCRERSIVSIAAAGAQKSFALTLFAALVGHGAPEA